MKRLSMLLVCVLIFALAACGAPGTTEAPTQVPASLPTWTPRPSPTSVPTATPAPTAAPTGLPIATYTAELSATVVASLPPTATPKPGEANVEPGIAGVEVLPLPDTGTTGPLWAVYSVGMRAFDPPQQHFVAVYARESGGFRELSRLELENPDYVDERGVRQVDLAPGRIWLEVQSGVGAHGGCYDLLSFDGQQLHDDVSSCSASPGASFLKDLNGDGTPEVVLDATDHYVFCYACGVRLVNYAVQRWDGQKMVEVTLAPLPDSAPAELRTLTNQAVDLARAGLWKDAQATISQTLKLGASDPAAAWDAGLIRLVAEGRAEQARSGAYPLLDNLFYGDYPAALDVLRQYPPEQLFAADTPLVKGSMAEGWEQQVTDSITTTTNLALQLKPDLAAAYFLRGWGVHLTSPASPGALADVERAAQLAPDDTLFTESLAYLRKR